MNEQIDPEIRKRAVSKRELCYDIIISALRSLKSEVSQKTYASPVRPAVTGSILDQASRRRYICQIVLLGVQSPDKLFHEYLYRAMIILGLEEELLEYGGPDLVPFLQNADIKEVTFSSSAFVIQTLCVGPSVIFPVRSNFLSLRIKINLSDLLNCSPLLW